MLDTRLGYASICKRVAGHTHWDFFLAPRHFFSFWTVCVSFDGPFLASISGRPLLLFH